MAQKNRRPSAIMLSKRANVFYIEHARVMQKNEKVVYMTEAGGGDLYQFVNIPDKNTAFVLLGKGCSITDAAVRKLSESNVLIGFCGSGGSPLFGALDQSFLLPQDEYRPTEYGLCWMNMWLDETKRIELAKKFLLQRIKWGEQFWKKEEIPWPDKASKHFEQNLIYVHSTDKLLSLEAHFAKSLYASLSQHHQISFVRDEGKREKATPEQAVNSCLDHGNYIAYGYAAVVLHGLGIPYFLPVLHGKTRRGALVFDVADLVKDWLIMPIAFHAGVKKVKDSEFRAKIIETAQTYKVLDLLFDFVLSCLTKETKKSSV